MVTCIVEMFGLPDEITALREVEVKLKDGANLTDLIAALRHKIPALEGHVIRANEDRLTEHYAFIIDGHFYLDDMKLRLQNGQHVALLTFAVGG